MGITRKILSVSTAGLVDFRSDKERTAAYTRGTRRATRRLVKQQRQREAQYDYPPPPDLSPPAMRAFFRGPDDPQELRVAKALGVLQDLDRCQHGRHQGDACFSCPGEVSAGNPHLPTGSTIGYQIGGRPIVVPARDRKHDPEAWLT